MDESQSTSPKGGGDEEARMPLSTVVRVKEVFVRKGREWGFVLRGTTTQFGSLNLRVYTCSIDSITKGGPAEAVGLHAGDQTQRSLVLNNFPNRFNLYKVVALRDTDIVSVNRVRLENLCHQDVIGMFQKATEVELVVMPMQYSKVTSVRINPGNPLSLSYLWCLTRTLQSLEVVHVPLERHGGLDLHFLPNLRSLRLTHCRLRSLAILKGLDWLSKLTNLVLTHNSLDSESFAIDCPLSYLLRLHTLDLGANELDRFPEVAIQLPNLEVLVLVNNNISSLPSNLLQVLTNLRTLCIDGNQLTNVDVVGRCLPSLEIFTYSNNFIDIPPHNLGQTSYDITSIAGNPFVKTFNKASLRKQSVVEERTLSIRGHASRRSSRFSFLIGSQGELELYRKATSLSPPPAPSHGPIKERPVSAMLDDRQDF